MNSFKLREKKGSQKRPERYHGERALLMEPAARGAVNEPDSPNPTHIKVRGPRRGGCSGLALLQWWFLMSRAERGC